MADRLFLDVRRFAAPPGRPYGAERFERRPASRALRRLATRWIDRRRGTDDALDPLAIPSYLPTDW